MRDLTGKRILVTRAAHQSASLFEALSAHGALPVEFPVIEIQSLLPSAEGDAALCALDQYDWVGFTSANGARITVNRWRELQEGPWPSNVSVAAVGTTTARALEDMGIPVRVVPDDFQGAALPGVLGHVSGRRVLLFRAEIATDAPRDKLREMGAVVHDLPVYRTVASTPDERHRAAGREGADAVTLTSPSTVRNFLDLAGRLSLPVHGMVVACIGPVTARAVRAAGHRVDVCAEPHTVVGLVDGLAAYFRERKARGVRPRTAAHRE